jgi:CheY-like chemotaxis protein
MAGYRVIEAATSAEMVQRMEGEAVDVLVAGFDLLSLDPLAIERIRRFPGAEGLRVIGLVNSIEEIEQRRTLHPEFDDYQVRFESDAMLRSVERLAQSLTDKSKVSPKAELVTS